MMADVWHTFSIHFLEIKMTKICSFAEIGYKTCLLTRLRHNNILPHITVASHVHKITDNFTICSIVCSVKEKEKKRTTQYWSFF